MDWLLLVSFGVMALVAATSVMAVWVILRDR